MPSARIRVIIVSGEPHFHQGLINMRIWIKMNMANAAFSLSLLLPAEYNIADRERAGFGLKVPAWMLHTEDRCASPAVVEEVLKLKVQINRQKCT